MLENSERRWRKKWEKKKWWQKEGEGRGRRDIERERRVACAVVGAKIFVFAGRRSVCGFVVAERRICFL
jgi:hypothetical protein